MRGCTVPTASATLTARLARVVTARAPHARASRPQALGGTLKAAKKRGLVAYDAPILLKGAHDKVVIRLLAPAQ